MAPCVVIMVEYGGIQIMLHFISKFDDWFFLDLHVLYKLWTWNCSASSTNQNKNTFMFPTRTKNRLSNFSHKNRTNSTQESYQPRKLKRIKTSQLVSIPYHPKLFTHLFFTSQESIKHFCPTLPISVSRTYNT